MINLLSKQKRDEIKLILLMRFFDLLFVTFFVGLTVLIVSLIPINSRLDKQKIEVDNISSILSSDENFNQVKNTTSSINISNDKLKVFPNQFPENGRMETIIDKITQIRGSGIIIKNFNYYGSGKNDTKTTNVEISGTANTRKDLLDFKQRLESEKGFSGIVLPISSFVKIENIEFSIKLRFE